MNLGLNLGLGGARGASSAPAITGFVGATTASAASASSIVIDVPADAEAGDILVVFGISTSTNEYNVPTGWTDRLTTLGIAMRSLASYDGTTPNYTFDISTATNQPQSIIMLAFRGYDWGAGTGTSGNAVDPSPPNLTIPAADSILVQIALAFAAGYTYSMPAGWTKRAEVSTGRSATAFQHDALVPSGLFTPTVMTRVTGTGNSRGVTFSLSPKP